MRTADLNRENMPAGLRAYRCYKADAPRTVFGRTCQRKWGNVTEVLISLPIVPMLFAIEPADWVATCMHDRNDCHGGFVNAINYQIREPIHRHTTHCFAGPNLVRQGCFANPR